MNKIKFGDRTIKLSLHHSGVVAVPAALQYYIERERFEDAEVFMFSIKLFTIELLIGIRVK